MFKKLIHLFIISILISLSSLHAQKTKVIIDTDPGIDDSVAIFLAFQSPEIEVIGLTSIFGNGEIELTTANCLRLCEIAGKKIPVAQGASQPLIIPKYPNPDFVHGIDGLGNIDSPPPQSKPVSDSADSFIIRTIMENPHEITLIALGPLTNLANAVLNEPNIISNVKEVIVYAGVIARPGNVSPIAEANAWGDPHAADIVLTAGWPITMIPLNASEKPQITQEILARIQSNNPSIGSFLYRINQFYLDFYLSRNPHLKGANVHDSLNIVYLINRELFTTETGVVRVATEGIAGGATIFDKTNSPYFQEWYGRPLITVCMDCDAERVMELIENRLSALSK